MRKSPAAPSRISMFMFFMFLLSIALSFAQEIPVTASPAANERIAVLIELQEPSAAQVYGETLRQFSGSPVQARARAAA
jgi:hypothetical protein